MDTWFHIYYARFYGHTKKFKNVVMPETVYTGANVNAWAARHLCGEKEHQFNAQTV